MQKERERVMPECLHQMSAGKESGGAKIGQRGTDEASKQGRTRALWEQRGVHLTHIGPAMMQYRQRIGLPFNQRSRHQMNEEEQQQEYLQRDADQWQACGD